MLEHLDDPHPPNPDGVALEAVRARAYRHQRRQQYLLAGAVVAVAAALLVPTVVLASPGRNRQTTPPEDTVSAPPASTGGGRGETSATQAPPSAGTTVRVTPTTQDETTTPGESGVRGVVILWPTCPVEGIGDDCRPQPAEATVRVRGRSSAATAATVGTGPDGRFQVALPPGGYVVTVETPKAEHCDPVDVTVASGRYTDVTVRCDTGIR